MTLVDRLRTLFQAQGLSEEDRRIYSESKSARELIRDLERLLGTNRIEYEQRYEELQAVLQVIEEQRARLRTGHLLGIEADRLMDDLELRLPQQTFLVSRVKLLKTNMLVQHRLIGKIQEQETMALRGVSEDDADAILERARDELASYSRDIKAGDGAEEAVMAVDATVERAEREARRRRLLGETPVADTTESDREQAVSKPELE